MESEKIHSDLKQAINDLHLISQTKQVKIDDEVSQLIKRHIFELSRELFSVSKLENYYWEFSSFNTYENHYTKRLDDYLKDNDNEEFSERDFIHNEQKNFSYLTRVWYLDFFDNETLIQIQKSFKKRKSFLNDRLDNLESKILDTTDFIDLGKLKAKEKLIYLYKLGVIDFLLEQQPFRSSPNLLASVLSSIIEVIPRTIQPTLSAIVSENLVNKNHPLYTESSEKKVNRQLINIGFNPKKNELGTP